MSERPLTTEELNKLLSGIFIHYKKGHMNNQETTISDKHKGISSSTNENYNELKELERKVKESLEKIQKHLAKK